MDKFDEVWGKMLKGEKYTALDPQLIRRLGVTKDVPANTVASGNPTKVIKQL